MSDKLQDLLIFRTIKLEYPIKDGHGNDITELNVRRAKAKDIFRMNAQKADQQDAYILAQITGLVPEDIAELDILDLMELKKALEDMTKGKLALNS